jgi:hypothetical protein
MRLGRSAMSCVLYCSEADYRYDYVQHHMRLRLGSRLCRTVDIVFHAGFTCPIFRGLTGRPAGRRKS